MSKFLKLMASILLLISLSGCALKMPLRPDGPVALKPNESLAVFKMTLKNDFKGYLLTPHTIFVEASAAHGGQTYQFVFGDPERILSDRELEMMGSFALPPGDYSITYFIGWTDFDLAAIAIGLGKFEPPFKRHFKVGSNETVYLGHIVARLVERTSDDEDRAGSIFPLVPQAVTGMSSGTFKFDILDEFDKDAAYVKARYPSIANKEFRKGLLSMSEAQPGAATLSQTPVKLRQSAEQVPVKSSPIIVPGSVGSDDCSVTQILEMRKLGLSDVQIKKSCTSVR